MFMFVRLHEWASIASIVFLIVFNLGPSLILAAIFSNLSKASGI